jgi:hypothetical protein
LAADAAGDSAEGHATPEPGTSLRPQSGAATGTGDSAEIGLRADSVVADQLTLANELHQQTTNYFQGSDTQGVTRLSREHFDAYEAADLEPYASDFLFDQAQVEPMVGALETCRVVILRGEPEIGKTSLALKLASRLKGGRPALLCRSIERNMRVDLEGLAGGDHDFRGRVLILENAFATRNPELVRLVSRFGSLQASYVRRLAKSESFWILTTSDLPETDQSLAALGVLQDVPRPRVDLLVEGFQKALLDAKSQSDDIAEAVSGLLAAPEKLRLLVEKLATFPRLARFVRESLPRMARGDVTLEQALARMDDPRQWLWRDLPEDLEAWSAVLTLTLCSAAPLVRSVPWLQFEKLRHALHRSLHRELGRPRMEREPQELCRGEWTLERARAELVSAPFPEPDGVRFLDARCSEHLWRALLEQGQLVITVLPLLRKWAAEGEVFECQTAARALGRCGEHDPIYLTFPLVQEWAHDGKSFLLGHFYQGILSSEDAGYRQGCLGWLRKLLESPDPDLAATATVALREVAALDLDFALTALRRLARSKLKLRWQELLVMEKRLRAIEERVRHVKRQDGVEPMKSFYRDAQQVLLATCVEKKSLRFLGAFQFTLTGLFLTVSDEAAVFAGLRDWMRSDPERLGPLVALLFLHRGGVAARLGRASSSKTDRAESSLFLQSLQASEESAAVVRGFLAEVFGHLRTFPGLFYTLLESQFEKLLSGWAKEARDDERVCGVIVDLLRCFFTSDDQRLSGWLIRQASSAAGDLKLLAVKAIASKTATAKQ